MNTRQMTYIIETAKTLNLSRAAENLYISQPSLSYQIKTIEREIGFNIFERIGKSIRLTPAGQQLVNSLQRISVDLQFAIEQAQNLNQKYKDNIKVGFVTRSALFYFPQAIKIFAQKKPYIQLIPEIKDQNSLINEFSQGELDILLLPKTEAQKLRGVSLHHLFDCHIYLLCQKSDPLSKKTLVSTKDLAYHTLLVNGGSSPTLRKVQQRVIQSVPINHYNSPTHDFTLIQVASGQAICLSPGFYNDHTNEFAWIPFNCTEYFDFVLVVHQDNLTEPIKFLIDTLQKLYAQSQLKF